MTNIAVQRLYAHQLMKSSLKTPADVVRHLGVMQAQDYTGALWSIGLRLPGSTEAEIERALNEKSFVRSWFLRGTLHFAAVEDARWLLALVGEGLLKGFARRHKELELDEAVFSQSHALITGALRKEKTVTRKELFALLEANGIATKAQRGIHILSTASLLGLICQTAVSGNQDATFMLLDDAVPAGKSLSREEALTELAQRYFTSRAPATLHDFGWWSGLPMADVRAGLAAVESQLETFTVEGKTYYQPKHMPELKQHEPTVMLLPGFDEYLISYRDRSDSLDPAHAKKVVPGGNGIFMPTILVDGRVVGLWKRTFKKGQVIIDFQPFESLSKEVLAAAAEAAKPYGDYLDLPVVMA